MNTQRPLILIADDEPNICRIAKILLDPNNYEVITAENGIDAYEKIIKHTCIIMYILYILSEKRVYQAHFYSEKRDISTEIFE